MGSRQGTQYANAKRPLGASSCHPIKPTPNDRNLSGPASGYDVVSNPLTVLSCPLIAGIDGPLLAAYRL